MIDARHGARRPFAPAALHPALSSFPLSPSLPPPLPAELTHTRRPVALHTAGTHLSLTLTYQQQNPRARESQRGPTNRRADHLSVLNPKTLWPPPRRAASGSGSTTTARCTRPSSSRGGCRTRNTSSGAFWGAAGGERRALAPFLAFASRARHASLAPLAPLAPPAAVRHLCGLPSDRPDHHALAIRASSGALHARAACRRRCSTRR